LAGYTLPQLKGECVDRDASLKPPGESAHSSPLLCHRI
jgi:hypothetical protein